MSNKYLVECYEYPNNDITEGKSVYKNVSIDKNGRKSYLKVEDMNKTVVIPLTKYFCEDIQKGMK